MKTPSVASNVKEKTNCFNMPSLFPLDLSESLNKFWQDLYGITDDPRIGLLQK